MNKQILTALAIAQIAIPAVSALNWRFDTAHSGAAFKIKHLMISNVTGTMTGVTGKAEYDGKNVKALKVEAQLDAKTINTGEPKRDTHLRSADFFDTEKFPTVAFKSKKVVKAGSKYRVVGDLTMHGVTKEVTLEMDPPTSIVKDPKGNEHVGTEARATVKRADYGISYNKALDHGGVMVGETVDITLDLDLVKEKDTASSDTGKKPG